jgi:hypothetical protein
MRKNIIMLCSALSFAMAATDDACAMSDVPDTSSENATSIADEKKWIAQLEALIADKEDGDMVTTACLKGEVTPFITCPVAAMRWFLGLMMGVLTGKEVYYPGGLSSFGRLLYLVSVGVTFWPCKISIPAACGQELQDIRDALAFCRTCATSRIKIEERQPQDGMFVFLLSSALEK